MLSRESDSAFQLIRADVISCVTPPGAILNAQGLARDLGQPLHVVEEALGRLASEGLVGPGPDGVVVTAFESDYLVELFELREALETQVARLAARRRNETDFIALRRDFEAFSLQSSTSTRSPAAKFYQLVQRFDEATDDAAANGFLADALAQVRGHLTRLRNVNPSTPRYFVAAQEQVRILDAILDRDELLAMQQTSVHLRASLASVLARMGVSSSWHPHN